MGKLIRQDINTGTEFDSISPRGVFEQGIRPVLKAYRVPTGASPPLNVAKNVQVLDEKWAECRKPENAALAAVDYIRRINRHWDDPDFWHQHEALTCKSGKRPRSNIHYWHPKLARNVERDEQHAERLRTAGWDILVVWECELGNRGVLFDRLLAFLGVPRQSSPERRARKH